MANDNNPDDKSEAGDKPASVPPSENAKPASVPPADTKAKSEPPAEAAKPASVPPAEAKAKSEPPPAEATKAKSEPPPAATTKAKSEPPPAQVKAKSEPPAAKELADAKDEVEEAAEAKAAEPEPKKESVAKTGKAKTGKKKAARVEEAPEAKTAAREAADAKHDAEVHGHPGAHQVNRREYIVMFFVLAILTALEVGIVKLPGIDKLLVRIALVALALTKAACVGLYYMHLKHETKVLRAYVMVPFAAPAIYAVVLISEAAWRLVRW
jgi:caa(3)-type oxidase subunit IV